MEKITVYETMDGTMHKTQKDAVRHAEAAYANALSKLASQLCQSTNGKYTATGDFIDANLNAFVSLKTLKDDIALQEEDEE